MLIVNADDYGRSPRETDVTLRFFNDARISSTTAMVFMSDSQRAAELAHDSAIDIGLHLNLSQPFSGKTSSGKLQEYHQRVVRFITSSKYSRCFYNPLLRKEFQYVYQAQFDEFVRLFERPPSHIDGHHHTHLCTNMLVDEIIPADLRVRRSFCFRAGEKGAVNRFYRGIVDRALVRKHKVTDFFFSLQQCLNDGKLGTVFDLAKTSTVELMTHPAEPKELEYLASDAYFTSLRDLQMGTYRSV